jgi:protein ImuA
MERELIVDKLRKELLAMQGFKVPGEAQRLDFGLGVIEQAFPNKVFPTSAVHEFLSGGPEAMAATSGFIAALTGKLMQLGGSCLWISKRRMQLPPALKLYGIDPDRVFFINVSASKDLLWTVEEALKCNAIAAVVGEINDLDFTASRRLQLAVEHSKVTGFIHRINPRQTDTVACVSRWQITPLASVPEPGMPGVGAPCWKVNLLKIRNGYPGTWQVQWGGQQFIPIAKHTTIAPTVSLKKTG